MMISDFDTLVADLRAGRKYIHELTPVEKKCLDDFTMVSLTNIKAAFDRLFETETEATYELGVFLSALRAVERDGE